jgi:hypothetical protein
LNYHFYTFFRLLFQLSITFKMRFTLSAALLAIQAMTVVAVPVADPATTQLEKRGVSGFPLLSTIMVS